MSMVDVYGSTVLSSDLTLLGAAAAAALVAVTGELIRPHTSSRSVTQCRGSAARVEKRYS